MRHAIAFVAAVAAGALLPAVALACPVCFSGTEENRTAYFLTFVLLTVLPLLSVGAVVCFIARRYRQAE